MWSYFRFWEIVVSNILIVDDSMTMRQMVNFTLASAGHKVTEAGNTDEALAQAQSQAFDLVISDVNMPGRTGIELVAELRKLPAYKFVPIILLTTESQPEMKSKGRAAGATGWIVKPFDPEALLNVLRKVLPA
jgi:two-component system chemotaxis response regulator CheY